ncbi:MAG: 50S ribosomal protein L11 methyltransferase [candidate division Zixibacteria bacterium]|nr:50S ribosomal protein L11 methyltransferase [candidate division Zixibacteria bacterium]
MISTEDKSEKSLAELRVELPQCHVDAVCDFIVENISSGLVLEDEEGNSSTVVIFYVDHVEVEKHKSCLASYLGSLVGDEMPTVPEIAYNTIANLVWEEEYRKSVVSVTVAEDITVVPPWLVESQSSRYQILIEPKMAFGTGKHETTRSCLTIMRNRFKPDMRFLDLGCGSGILSILADKMGASYVKAVDYDVTAVENCRENFQINNVTTPNDIIFGSIEKCRRDHPYEFVCANIIKITILEMLDDLISLTTTSGILLLSGLLDSDTDDIIAALEKRRLTDFEIHPDNEWRSFIIFTGD